MLYNIITRKRLESLRLKERYDSRHRLHRWALATPFALFPFLYFLPWNVIYAGIAAMIAGAHTAAEHAPHVQTHLRRHEEGD